MKSDADKVTDLRLGLSAIIAMADDLGPWAARMVVAGVMTMEQAEKLVAISERAQQTLDENE